MHAPVIGAEVVQEELNTDITTSSPASPPETAIVANPVPEPDLIPASRYPKRSSRTTWQERSNSWKEMSMVCIYAVEKYGNKADDAVELMQLLDLEVWTPELASSLTKKELSAAIYSSVFLKD